METIAIGPALTLTEVLDLAHAQKRAHLHESAAERVDASRRAVEAIIARGDTAPPVYGINTGFGALAETRIEAGDIRALQLNLIRSHACGVGPRLAPAEVRAMMVLRAQVIAQGHSGVRREVLELLLGMLNAGVVPEIPGQGSVGASGDLAPLAHLALALIGEGQAHYEGVTMAAGRALERAGLKPVELRAKEGLALINGTQMMTGVGALALGR
ncbi:MAG: aromatic amino acid lyase, partial [Myxococcota bacterium]